MTFNPHGDHLIAGKRVGAEARFSSTPATGTAFEFSGGSPALVAQACAAAHAAFPGFAATSREQRAKLLETIADEIDARGEQITEIGAAETGLPAARLQGERGRTTGQLRLFASYILAGDYLDRRHDEALPGRQPLPRPDLRMMQRPVGPVAVFGASNFPLAFSVAGGDTAAALAAGCPVVVKGHGAHPGTGELVGDAIVAALEKLGMDAGLFSLVQGGSRAVGEALVTDHGSRPSASPEALAVGARSLIFAHRAPSQSRSSGSSEASIPCSFCRTPPPPVVRISEPVGPEV